LTGKIVDIRRKKHSMVYSTRGLALRIIVIFLFGTGVGSVLPESGNALAYLLKITAHYFNIVFLAIGVIGTLLALYFGYKKCCHYS
jgi:hypothetical protein